jgi:prophage DNA circulation protein
MKQEMWTAQAVAGIEGQSLDLVQQAPTSAKVETSADIAPVIQKIADSSIAEIEKLLAQLHKTRNSLQSEGERVQREAANYMDFTQMASASIKIISDTVKEWSKAGYPVHNQPKALEVTPAEPANDTAETCVQAEQPPLLINQDRPWYAIRAKGV